MAAPIVFRAAQALAAVFDYGAQVRAPLPCGFCSQQSSRKGCDAGSRTLTSGFHGVSRARYLAAPCEANWHRGRWGLASSPVIKLLLAAACLLQTSFAEGGYCRDGTVLKTSVAG